MTTGSLIALAILVLALALTSPLLGRYIAHVFEPEPKHNAGWLHRLEERLLRAAGIDPLSEQTWRAYAISIVVFSALGVLALYAIQRLQEILPGNSTHLGAVAPALALNTAVSFVTNTDWQNYSGESTMSIATQMAGLAVQNFISAGVGISVALALVRGLTRDRGRTIGNFYVDITRAITRLLLPLSVLFAVLLTAQGVVDNLTASKCITTIAGAHQCLPGGLVATQEAIKELGTNGGGYFGANSAHPFENPNAFTNFEEIFALLVIPFSLPFAFGTMSGRKRQGIAIFSAMFLIWISSAGALMYFQSSPAPLNHQVGISSPTTRNGGGGNLEGLELRFSSAGCAMFAASTTGTSTGATNCALDSLTPIAGGVALSNMMLGEVDPGGVGSGLYGILIFAILAVFIAGLMVGRTPEYLGKKIQAAEMKLVMIYLLVSPIAILIFSATAVLIPSARAQVSNPGPHGLTEIVYSYVSTGNNNGSAFAGLSSNTDFYNITQALNMVIGRFGLIIPVLAIAGSLVRKTTTPITNGTFPTDTPLFVTILIGVILLLVGLTYFPVLALGPLVEHLQGHF